jgi:type IV secretion system protein VirB9
MRKSIAIAVCAALLHSCASFDVAKRINTSESGRVQGVKEEPYVLVTVADPPPPVIIEKPVFIPASEAAPPKTPLSALDTVRESNKDGITSPSEYSHAAMIYDYNPHLVYEVYTQPLRVSDIYLKPGEKAVESPFVSDSERWILGAGVSYDQGVAVQHIYIKPTAAGLEASLIINTNERVYHLLLRSYNTVHMPKVMWRYIENTMPQVYIPETGQAAQSAADTAEIAVDPHALNFNYKVTYPLFGKPKWLPELVYDDAQKTYITFPSDIRQNGMPTLFENRKDIVNYRVVQNVVILDKLVDTLTIKIGKQQVIVAKKK